MICNDLALAANLPGQYIAWLSSSALDASERLGSANGWIRSDRRPFSLSREDLLSEGGIVYPLNLDENGQEVNYDRNSFSTGRVTTGTTARGTRDENCQDWSGGTSTLTGVTNSADWEWTSDDEAPCVGILLHLYCFGVSEETPLAPPHAAAGRLAWVSNEVAADVGISGMDAVCLSEASALGVGAAKAFVATTTASASSRFDVTGATWVRPDGIVLWEQAADMINKGTLAPIAIMANGDMLVDEKTWSGAEDATSTANVSGEDNCDNWSNAQEGRSLAGNTGYNGYASLMHGNSSCTRPTNVYCFEE